MGWRILADVTMSAHFAFLVYVALGGFLAWKWRWALIPHLGVAAYAGGTVVIGWPCPLTDWENEFRFRAGQEGLPATGFIDHYIEGVVYPEGNIVYAQSAVALMIAISWIGFYWLYKRRQHRDELKAQALDEQHERKSDDAAQ